MEILAIILGILFAAGVACLILSLQISKSNNYGDNCGTLEDFSKGSYKEIRRKEYGRKEELWQHEKDTNDRISNFLRTP